MRRAAGVYNGAPRWRDAPSRHVQPKRGARGVQRAVLHGERARGARAERRAAWRAREDGAHRIGRVVSGFLDAGGALQCVMELDESTVEGAIAGGFVRDGVAADLSLGYSVDVQHTNDRLKAGAKRMLEISIVRKGARQGCHIHAYQPDDAAVVYKARAADRADGTWDCFEL